MKYELMHRNLPTAVIEIDETKGFIKKIESIYEPDHLPVGTTDVTGKTNRNSVNEWWLNRSIPVYRPGLVKMLYLFEFSDPAQLLLCCHGLSLSDQYWIRPAGNDLSWNKINFFDNSFSEDVGDYLFGLNSHKYNMDFSSPDCTTNGNLKKRWKIIDGKRYLIKGGDLQEPFNEVIASKIMDQLDIQHVPYSIGRIDGIPYSLCEDFVKPETDLVPAWMIIQTRKKRNETSAWQHFVDCCNELGIPGTVEFLDRMIVLDCIIANEDRHALRLIPDHPAGDDAARGVTALRPFIFAGEQGQRIIEHSGGLRQRSDVTRSDGIICVYFIDHDPVFPVDKETVARLQQLTVISGSVEFRFDNHSFPAF